MKLAIMQPYLFPYIGYFQLINAADKFVIYDDVNFIKQGWINRNNVLVNGKSLLFTVPLNNPSSFMKINEVLLNENHYQNWKIKFLRTLEQSYKKAPYFLEVFEVVKCILTANSNITISKLAVNSLVEICKYLDLKKEFVFTSTIYGNSELSGKERVIDICTKEEATHYINPIGGQSLYNKDYFRTKGIELSFIRTLQISYQQFENDFVPLLSIIDVLMFNDPSDIIRKLELYDLV